MAGIQEQLRTIMLSFPSIVARTDTRIYAIPDLEPPAYYRPKPGPADSGRVSEIGEAIIFQVQEPRPTTSMDVLRAAVLRVRTYGADDDAAESLGEELERQLNGFAQFPIQAITVAVATQGKPDRNGWPSAVTLYRLVTISPR